VLVLVHGPLQVPDNRRTHTSSLQIFTNRFSEKPGNILVCLVCKLLQLIPYLFIKLLIPQQAFFSPQCFVEFLDKIKSPDGLRTGSPIKGEKIIGITNNSPPLVGGARGGGILLIMKTYLWDMTLDYLDKSRYSLMRPPCQAAKDKFMNEESRACRKLSSPPQNPYCFLMKSVARSKLFICWNRNERRDIQA
jgi:hypothetical protein